MADGPITVHAPVDPGHFQGKLRRKPYRTLCGKFTSLPQTIRMRKDDEGIYLVAEPHERYHEWCLACHERSPIPLRDLA